MMIHIHKDDREDFTLLFLEPSANKPKPTELRTLRDQLPTVDGRKGLILACQMSQSYSGWLLSYAVSHYRNRALWFAIYDPKLHGAVVYESFSLEIAIADVIPVQFKDQISGEWVRMGASVPYKQENRRKAPHWQ